LLAQNVKPKEKIQEEIEMKEIKVFSCSKMDGTKMSGDGNEFTVKDIIARTDAKQCRASFVEVEPGNYAYGYHYHEMDEEIFYVINGTGIVRTPKGDVTVNAGEAITLPTGPDGAHVMRNGSDTEKLIYIDFDTNNVPEIVHFPDIKKVMAYGPFSNGMYDENK